MKKPINRMKNVPANGHADTRTVSDEHAEEIRARDQAFALARGRLADACLLRRQAEDEAEAARQALWAAVQAAASAQGIPPDEGWNYSVQDRVFTKVSKGAVGK